MKIAHAIFGLPSGGAETLVVELCLALRRRGHNVDVLMIDRYSHSTHETVMLEKLKKGGIPVYSLGRRPGSGCAVAGPVARALKIINQQRYDIIHSHLALSHSLIGLVKLISPVRFKHVVTVHSTKEKWGGLTSKLVRKATIVCCSNTVASNFQVNREKKIILNGVNYPDSRNPGVDVAKFRSSLGIPACATMLISVGHLSKPKNYSEALDVISILQREKPEKDFHYVICGTGPEENTIMQKIESLPLKGRIHLLGDRLDVPDLLSSADCFISASLWEGLPLSVLEAFFSGIKCALSPIEEHRDIASGIAGCVLASDEKAPSMAAAVLEALAQKQSREELKQLRRPSLKKFSFETCVESYETLYRSLVED